MKTLDQHKQTISVIMTTYNGTKYVLEQLQSIADQTMQPDEVLIFDDCSTDRKTPEIISEFIEKNSLVGWRLIKNEYNMGWKKNFIQAVKSASSDLIFLADQDDIWEKDKISRMVNAMQEDVRIKLLCSNYNFLNETGKHIRSNSVQRRVDNNDITKVGMTPKFHLVGRPGCTYCLRREFALKATNAWIEELAHDQLFWMAAIITEGLYCINSSLIKFRRHENNASGRGTVLKKKERLYKHNVCGDAFNKILEVFQGEIDLSVKEKRNIIEKYRRWIVQRSELLSRCSFINIIKTVKYISFYSSVLSFAVDALPEKCIMIFKR